MVHIQATTTPKNLRLSACTISDPWRPIGCSTYPIGQQEVTPHVVGGLPLFAPDMVHAGLRQALWGKGLGWIPRWHGACIRVQHEHDRMHVLH